MRPVTEKVSFCNHADKGFEVFVCFNSDICGEPTHLCVCLEANVCWKLLTWVFRHMYCKALFDMSCDDPVQLTRANY